MGDISEALQIQPFISHIQKLRLILLRPNNNPLYVHTPYCLYIYQPVGMCGFQLFVGVYNTSMNVCVQVSVKIHA